MPLKKMILPADVEDEGGEKNPESNGNGFAVPNSEGVFEDFERVRIGGLPVKCTGEFQLAHVEREYTHDAGTESAPGYYVGYFLHMRQPLNTAQHAPSMVMPFFPTRIGALSWLVGEIAGNFFSDHKIASERLKAWWKKFAEAEGCRVAEESPTAAAEPAAAEVAIKEVARPMEVAPEGAIRSHFEHIAVNNVERNPANPRREFAEEPMVELTESIRAQGFLLQPIAVRDLGADERPRYRLISGERRWIAHQRLGWTDIEAKVFVGVSDAQAGELALIENLQRRDLNPLEEAKGFVELRDRYGYDVARIAARTGKAESTIKNSIRIAALPERVCELIQSRQLAPTVALRLATPRWTARPEHCAALAGWVVAERITQRELEAPALPCGAMCALASEDLAVEITEYRDRVEFPNSSDAANSEIIAAADETLWHLNPPQWKEERAALDRADDEKAKREKEKAAKRVATAQEVKVNVKVDDLRRAAVSFHPLTGDDLRYVPHLPAHLVTTAVDGDERELVVCLKPSALKKLKAREEQLVAKDREDKLPALHDRATAELKKLRKVGPREMAFIVHAAVSHDYQRTPRSLWSDAWARQELPEPKTSLPGAADLAAREPSVLARVFFESTLTQARDTHTLDQYLATLRWILEQPSLGLAEETPDGLESLTAKAAAEVFAEERFTTDPKTLAEWQRAYGQDMPLNEIARSYKVPVADVCGALGIPVPAND